MHSAAAAKENVLAASRSFFRHHNADYSVAFVEAEPFRTVRWLTQRHYVERSADPIYGLCGLPRPQHIHRDLNVMRANADQQQEFLHVLYSTFFMRPEI